MSAACPQHHPLYTYRPIRRGELRLVRLQPASDFNAPLHCDLVHGNYSDRYEALSYCWGDGAHDQRIHVDRNSYLPLSTELQTALRYLRRPRAARALWIDALCIDQSSSGEKQEQIPLMDRVYGLSQNCVAWMGEADHDTKQLLRAMKVFRLFPIPQSASQVHRLWRMPGRERLLRLVNVAFETDIYSQLALMLEGHWLKRLWTLQEFVLSPKVEFVYGRESIRSKTFVLGALVAASMFKNWRVPASFNRFLARYECLGLVDLSECEYDSRVLSALLVQIKSSQCRYTEDNVYATLGMMRQLRMDISTVPDKSRPIPEIYAWATYQWIVNSGSLHCLAFACTEHVERDLPSWVVDWTTAMPKDWDVRYDIYLTPSPQGVPLRATKASHLRTKKKDDVILSFSVHGMMIDHVSHVHAVMPPRDNDINSYQLTRSVLERILFLRHHRKSEGQLKKWISDLTDLVATHEVQFLMMDSADRTKAHLSTFFQHLSTHFPEPPNEDVWEEMHELSRNLYETKRWACEMAVKSIELDSLFITEGGRLGLFRHYGPRRILEHDKIVLVAGLGFPIVLRQKEEGSQRDWILGFEFVGFAVVSGVMNGELWPDDLEEVNLDEFKLV